MNERWTEKSPAPVPDRAKQAGETRARWAWVEPEVWTERMLTALKQGVKGGKWYSLMDKVYTLANLRKAFTRVKANGGAAGVDHQTIAMFEKHLETNLEQLARALKEGNYRPRAIRRVWIPKPGSSKGRPLGIPAIRDRVVQTALRHVLEPIFEKEFAQHSYGFRPNRGPKDALRRVEALLKAGYHWVVDADLQNYFDTIPRQPLLDRIRGRVADGQIIGLIEAYLTQDVLEGTVRWTPEGGSPQGAIISPLLSNIYLDPLDHLMAEKGYEMIRFADDFVILCRSAAEAEMALQMVQNWTQTAGLNLHPEKTQIVDTQQPGGFDFLGYHFEHGRRWPRRKSLRKLKDTLRAKTKRTNGHSLQAIITNINPILRGWFEYYKHSTKSTFIRLDKWIRMRMRSILRKRQGRRGRGRGNDNHRWPNAFFTEHGLFSLTAAREAACQSARR